MSTDAPRQPPNTKEGWNAFVSRPSRPEPPRLLAEADLERLDPDERELYDYARMDYHSELNLINTPDLRKIITAGEKLVIGNRGKQLGRRGLIVSGPSGTGKSTSITWLGKIHQVDTERRAPHSDGRIPVVYIIVPPAATPKMLAVEIATFLGLPFSSHEPQHFITQSVAGVLRKVGCSLILVDEVHRLDLRTRPGAAASDQLKYFFDSVSATFVFSELKIIINIYWSGRFSGCSADGRNKEMDVGVVFSELKAHRQPRARQRPISTMYYQLFLDTVSGTGRLADFSDAHSRRSVPDCSNCWPGWYPSRVDVSGGWLIAASASGEGIARIACAGDHLA